MHPIAQNPNAHSPTNIAGDNNSTATNREVPKMAVREFFFSFLSEADRKRTDQGWNAAKRRFDGFIRFVSTAPAKIRGDLSEANKALLNAAKRNDVEEVKRQIEAQAEVNHADPNGMTAIMHAALRGDCAMLRMLIAAGAGINQRNVQGQTALMLAARSGNADAVRLLLDWGAEADLVDNLGLTAFLHAAQTGRTGAIAVFQQAGVDIHAPAKDGTPPLMLAVRQGHRDFTEELLRKGADINGFNSSNGETALLFAADAGKSDMVEWLLDKGASIDIAQQDGMTPLMVAARKGHADVVRALLARGADIGKEDIKGCTAMMHAAFEDRANIIPLLREAGDKGNSVSNNQRTALMYAAMSGSLNATRALLEIGIDVDSVDQDGRSALILAAQNGHPSIVELLLARNADTERVDNNHWDAVMHAADQGHTEIIQQLRASGASVEGGRGGRYTPLMLALRNGHYEAAVTLVNCGASLLVSMENAYHNLNYRLLENLARLQLDPACSKKLNDYQVLVYAIRSGWDRNAFFALADGGFRLNEQELARFDSYPHGIRYLMRLLFVESRIPLVKQAMNLHASGAHDEADSAYTLMRSGQSAARRDQIWSPAHYVVHVYAPSAGDAEEYSYLHALGRVCESRRKGDLSDNTHAMFLDGWSSEVTTLVRQSHREAIKATQSVQILVNRRHSPFVLIDRAGKTVAANDKRLKDTLFSFELGRHQRLNQLASAAHSKQATSDPDASADEVLYAAVHQVPDGSEAQAQAILVSNDRYEPLKLHLPALARARKLETEARIDESRIEAALSEITQLQNEAEQLFFETQETGPELARHWLLSEMNEMLEEIDGVRSRLQELAQQNASQPGPAEPAPTQVINPA